jgi:membrane associated rhomboid family serine protease
MTPVVRALLIANGLLFLAEMAGWGDPMLQWFALWPPGLLTQGIVPAPSFYPWQMLTYAFLHGSIVHLGLNMFALWQFGTRLEMVWGPRRFGFYYFSCVLGAALAQILVSEWMLYVGAVPYPVIGASGGVFGLLLAYGLLFPETMIMLLIPPIPMKAKWFVLGYGLVELLTGITGTASGVAHFAHLGGMLTGWLLLRAKF